MPIRLNLKQIKEKKKKKKEKKDKHLLRVKGKIAIHLEKDPPQQSGHQNSDKKFSVNPWNILQRIHQAGRRKIVVMLIPHTNKNITKIPLRIYTVWLVSLVTTLVMLVTVVNIIDRSGKDVQFYDLGITDEQFDSQVIKMAEKMIPMHEVIDGYYNTLFEIAQKMDINNQQLENTNIFANDLSQIEVKKFKKLIENCQSEKQKCNKAETEKILQKMIYISQMDNEKMRSAVKYFDKILSELNTDEKKNLFQSIPNIWPTNGYLLRSYGNQIDGQVGKRIFKRGIDIGTVAGAAVKATAPGMVKRISYDEEFGLNILIEHSYGISTLYAHLNKITVKINQEVEREQKIGTIDYSIKGQIYKLYYEVHVGAIAYDPLAFLNHPEAVWLNNLKN